MSAPKELPTAKALTLKLDLTSPFASTNLACFMCWPHNESQRATYQAAFGMGILAESEEFISSFFVKLVGLTDLPNVSRRDFDLFLNETLDGDEKEIEFMWCIIEQASAAFGQRNIEESDVVCDFVKACRDLTARTKIATLMRGLFKDIHKELFSGSFTNAANSPSQEQAELELHRLESGEPKWAGMLLCLIASLSLHHKTHGNRKITASLNRACAATETLTKGITIRSLKDYWRDWSCVAPLWAGAMAANKYGPLEPGWLYSILMDDEKLLRTLEYAAWFRSFAMNHQERNARDVLIPVKRIVQLPSSISPRDPEVPPLKGRLFTLAMEYQAEYT